MMMPKDLQMWESEVDDGPQKAKKGKTPVVQLSRGDDGATEVDDLARIMRQKKDLEGQIKGLQAVVQAFAQAQREEYCRTTGAYQGSIKLSSPSGTSITVVSRSQYSKIDRATKEKIIAVLDGLGHEGHSAFDELFTGQLSASIDAGALVDPDNRDLLQRLLKQEPRLKSILSLSVTYTPREAFHQAALTNKGAAKVMEALTDERLLKPYSPTFRV